MKKTAYLLVMVFLIGCFTAFFGCKKYDEWNPEYKAALPNAKYSDSAVVTPAVSALKYAADSLSGEDILYHINGTDENIIPDDTTADSAAINAALVKLKNMGGGTLFLPRGVYRLDSPIIMQKSTQITGEWDVPGESSIKAGTQLVITFGAGLDSEETGSAAVRMAGGSKISNLIISYANQNAENPVAYPYTIANGEYYGATIERITMLNSYRGIKFESHNVITVKDVYMTALNTGLYINGVYDIGIQENINISYKYWAMAEGLLPKIPSASAVRAVTREAVAFAFGRYDWIYSNHCFAEGYGYGLKTIVTSTGTLNGQIMNFKARDCRVGIGIDASNDIGVQITRADIEATGADSAGIDSSVKFTFGTVYQFNDCSISSEGNAVRGLGSGVMTFAHCSFQGKSAAEETAYLDAGSYIFDRCSFSSAGEDIIITGDLEDDSNYPKVSTVKITNCSFTGTKNIVNGLEDSGYRYIETSQDYGSMDSGKLAIPDIVGKKVAAPQKKDIFDAGNYGAVADGSLGGLSGTDNTKAIQHALNAAGSNGGGYVYLGAGVYYVKDYLVIPENVFLVGAAVTNKHFGVMEKGTTLVTANGKGAGRKSNAFLNLAKSGGVALLNVFYPDQHYKNNVKYTPAIFAGGDNATVDRVTIPNAYVGLFANGVKGLHNSFSRITGLNTAYSLCNVSDSQIDYILTSGGDWQDAEAGGRVSNAPPQNLWLTHPNYENVALYMKNCSDIILYECFTFGMGKGLLLEGEINRLTAIGYGVDAARDSIVLSNSGVDNVFVGTELVGLDAYLRTTAGYEGTTTFYNTMAWMSMDVNTVFDGKGTVNMQQYKTMNGQIQVNNGQVNISDSYFAAISNHLTFGTKAKGGVLNCLGAGVGFDSSDEYNDNFRSFNCTFI